MNVDIEEIFERVRAERARQHEKFGSDPFASSEQFISILGEEIGEVCRAINQDQSAQEATECIHCIAVLVAHLEGDLHNGKTR